MIPKHPPIAPAHLKREITGFYTDKCEILTLLPLAEMAPSRGYTFTLSTDGGERAEIGIYPAHAPYRLNKKSRFSLGVLHDLAQGHNTWPDIWVNEPWNPFDIGILPNQDWADRWQLARRNLLANPRLGMFVGGWPKADVVTNNKEHFNKEAQTIRDNLRLKYDTSVLYAPSWEMDAQQHEFVLALKDQPVNLIIKQAPWPDTYPDQQENIRIMAELHRNYADNIYIIDPKVNIMHCLALADIVVSDHSSVLVEALLFAIPSVAVRDWTIIEPGVLNTFPLDFVFHVVKSELQTKVRHLLKYKESLKVGLEEQKDRFFPYRGESSKRFFDILDAVMQGTLPEGRL